MCVSDSRYCYRHEFPPFLLHRCCAIECIWGSGNALWFRNFHLIATTLAFGKYEKLLIDNYNEYKMSREILQIEIEKHSYEWVNWMSYKRIYIRFG